MRKITLYKFNELSNEAQSLALDSEIVFHIENTSELITPEITKEAMKDINPSSALYSILLERHKDYMLEALEDNEYFSDGTLYLGDD